MTGCAQFSASCPEPLPLLSLAVQPLVIAALFALPPAAAVGAFATIVSFAVAVPVATVLSVGPGSSGKVGAILLGVAVTVAYFVAMVAGAIAIWRPRRDPHGRARRPDPAPRPSRAVGRDHRHVHSGACNAVTTPPTSRPPRRSTCSRCA